MKRVLLKLSGEALSGEKGTGFDEKTVMEVAGQIKELSEQGIQIGIVIGGGNFWRGRSSGRMNRNKADQIGMLSTVLNCIYVSDALNSLGVKTRIMTPFVCGGFTMLYSYDQAVAGLEEGIVTFFAGGTGHPYFSTDTATALRAIEIGADVIMLAKSVDGVYDSDPKDNPDAVKFDDISIQEVLSRRLGVMDLAASTLCMENNMPLLVFGLGEERSIVRAASGERIGTRVYIERS